MHILGAIAELPETALGQTKGLGRRIPMRWCRLARRSHPALDSGERGFGGLSEASGLAQKPAKPTC
jgi:hypothetical protein